MATFEPVDEAPQGTKFEPVDQPAAAPVSRFEEVPSSFEEPDVASPLDIASKTLAGIVSPQRYVGEQMSKVATGLGRTIFSILKAPGQAAQAVDSLVEGPRLPNSTTSFLLNSPKYVQKLEDEFFPPLKPNPTFDDKLFEGAGGALAFMGGGALAQLGGITPAMSTLLMGAGVGGSQQYEEALAMGATPNEAALALAGGAAFGATEAIPGTYFLNKFNKLSGGKIYDSVKNFRGAHDGGPVMEAIKGALAESIQEGMQTVGSNWVASDLAAYDPNRTLGENFWENALTAGVLGSAIGGTYGLIHKAEVNKTLQAIEAAKLAKLTSGDPINFIEGEFTPTGDLIRLRALSDRMKQELAAAAQEASLELNQTSAPDIIPMLDQGPRFLGLDTNSNAPNPVAPLLTQTVDPMIEKGLLTADGKPMTVREALQKQDVISFNVNPYKELTETLDGNIKTLEQMYARNTQAQVPQETLDIINKQLKILKDQRIELMAKTNITTRLLAQIKQYSAAFKHAIDPSFKLIVTNKGTTNETENIAGSFTQVNDIQLVRGSVDETPVGILYVNLDSLVTEIYNNKKMGLNEETHRQRRRLFETINHELGHSIAINHILRLYTDVTTGDTATRQAALQAMDLMVGEYTRWLQKAAQSKKAFLLLSQFSPERAKDTADTMTGVNSESMHELYGKEYYLSFDEFFAEMTARLATQGTFANSEFARSPMMTRYFAPVLQQYQQMFEYMPAFAKAEYANDWKKFLESRMLENKIKDVLETVKASDMGNIIRALRGKIPGFNSDAFAGLDEHLDKFDKIISWGFNLMQLAQQNPHIPHLQEYLTATAGWAEYQRNFQADANPIIKAWRGLEKGEASTLTDVIYEEALGRKRIDPAILQQKLTAEAMEVYTALRAQLDRVLEEMRATAMQDALLSFTGNEEILKTEMESINEDFDRMKDHGYFPFIRFGKYTIVARAKRALIYRGDKYKAGELISFPAFETARERDAAAVDIRRELGDGANVASSVMRETDFVIQGMPRSLLRSLRNKLEAAGNFTEDQQKSFDAVMAETAPFRNFRKHFLRKKGIHGYSEDAIRSFAYYMRSAAGHIARVRFNDALRGPIARMQLDTEIIKEVGGRADERQEMRHWLDRHFSYIMNPDNEWAALRGVGFVAYLGFNIKSALINSTQLITTVAPYLAARYGDKDAISSLTRATWTLKDWVTRKQDFVNALEDIEGKVAKPDVKKQGIGKMIARGVHEGWLDQSLATELAIAASENNLDRGLYLPKAKATWHHISRWSALPFHLVEKMNRYITAIAAYDLEMRKSGDQEKATIAARQANWSANYENARWNRPEFMRGKKSILFLFGNYLQNTLYFATHDPGAVRYWLIMLLLAGVMGLPGAEDAADLADAGATYLNRILGLQNPKTQLRREARELLEELGLNPDLILHGLSQDSFGLGHVGELTGVPIPHLDVSRSVGAGDVLPLTEVPAMLQQRDANDVLVAAAASAAGAQGNLVESFYRNLFSTEQDDWRRAERLMPFVAAKNLMKGYRLAGTGVETTQDGTVIAEFDPHDLRDNLELIGQSLGFSPAETTLGWEKEIAQRDMVQYYKVQQEGLLKQIQWAFFQEDREARADSLDAIYKYNKQVPQPEMQIGPKTIRESLKSYLERRAVAGAGFAAEKKYRRLREQVEASYADPWGDQRRNDSDAADPP